ncbi:[FeFe] hydrogenase H-cluster radical SAM maturase HydE [uncultured Ruminococcus sp.]|uniref:[FeFe] hydrogenase H-cluster radical SAM maturase HydE n=1 Tax=uncultured Ruminococcus sp. TaxID=165186 RepID=UPI00292E20F5|nr:[FeFe] hydrogenase H-cluster radical SAM maturase HydE [uncultured Ruminococcus sp.]
MTDKLVEKLRRERDLSDSELKELIESGAHDEALRQAADEVRRERYGDAVFLRGLIEFTSYCKNNCLYCGLRAGNRNAERYRLSKDEILACCAEGYALGYRTFVLQGGEDPYYTDDMICDIVREIRARYPDCAITLSIGEKPRESYERYFEAGANRYLLRHETADLIHYGQLHPADMSGENRKRCLRDLKEIGYQVGSGFMVGSPYQTTDNLIADLRFLQKLQPDMIGIGPYITHRDTPFKNEKNGSVELTLRMLSILRLMFPYALLPSTTALGTIDPHGRELGLQSGGNVVMPNLSPTGVREKYAIYDNKICTGEESAQCRRCLEMRIESAGYRAVTDRGDVRRDETGVKDDT